MCCEELRKSLGGKSECYSNSTVAKENGKEFRLNLNANSTACKVRIDGCVMDSQVLAKCDYLFKICPVNKYHLVELKGTDVDHAVHQIVSTFNMTKMRLKEEPANFTGHIISSAIPRAAEQKFRNLKDKAMKNNKLNIVKHSFKSEVFY